MLPTLLEGPGGLGVHTYGLFIALAFTAAFLVTHTKASAAGIHPFRLIPVYVAAAIGGLVGGRILFSIAVEPGLGALLQSPLSIVQGSGFALYGGVIGGALAVGAVALPLGIPPWKLADIAAPSVLIGIGTGRLGCFFAGCCHGAVAPLGPSARGLLGEDALLHGQIWLSERFPFVALEFHDGVGRILDQPLYPTQLWHALGCFALTGLLLGLWSHRRFDGQIAAIALMLEPLLRGVVEAFRSDQRGYAITFQVGEELANRLPPGMHQAGLSLDATVAGLTTSQFLGLGMVLLGIVIYAARRHAGVAPEIPLDPDAGMDEEPDESAA